MIEKTIIAAVTAVIIVAAIHSLRPGFDHTFCVIDRALQHTHHVVTTNCR